MGQPRGECDDAAAPAGDHALNCSLLAPHDTIEIDADDPSPFFGCHLMSPRARLNGCSADQTIDAAKFPLDLAECREDRGAVADIEAHVENHGFSAFALRMPGSSISRMMTRAPSAAAARASARPMPFAPPVMSDYVAVGFKPRSHDSTKAGRYSLPFS